MSKRKSTKQPLQKSKPRNVPDQSKDLRRVVQMEQHKGPLPRSSELQKYEDVIKGAADRIICMAEDRQKHIIDMKSHGLAQANGHVKRGQYMAFFLAVLGLFLGTYLAISGHGWAAGGLGLLGVSFLLSQFLKPWRIR